MREVLNMKILPSVLAIAAASLLPSAALAQNVGDAPIVVEGTRLPTEQEVRDLARKVGSDIDLLRPIPRFYSPLCLDVSGVRDEHSEAFAARIRENARAAGVPTASDKCVPNAMVIFANDARKQLTNLRKQRPGLFGGISRDEFKKIINSREPAFAWRVKEVTGLFGVKFDRDILANGLQGFPINPTYEVGRLNPPIRMETSSAVVVIEHASATGKTAEQLADYATMRLLAPTAELTTVGDDVPSTIMTLFLEGKRAPGGLTSFDRAYLTSTYAIRANGPSGMVFPETARLMKEGETSGGS
jgi:hypothetical protein